MRKIVVTVTQDAVTKTDYIHFEGAECLAESERFHALLTQFGVQVQTTRTTPKPELLNALSSQHEVSSQEVLQNRGTEE